MKAMSRMPHPSPRTPQTDTGGRRRHAHRVTLLAYLMAAALALNTVYSAPQAPTVADGWRWSTLAVAACLCLWNIASSVRAYRLAGLLSIQGFLHLWCFFTFSFPAFEMTYRYRYFTLGLWKAPTDQPVLLKAVLILALFQVLFFWGLGHDPRAALARFVATTKLGKPRPVVGLVYLALVLPLVLARVSVVHGLGLRGVAQTAVTRVDVLKQVPGGVSAFQFILNAFFPLYSVALLCLAIKYLFSHPSKAGRWAYVAALTTSAAGVLVTGGRGDLVYVVFTVIVFMYAEGYRYPRQYRLLLVPAAALAVTFVLTSQARHGATNALSQLGGQPYVGKDYASGDITQLLGVGRFDVVVMILDKSDPERPLLGKSYTAAFAGAANATFAPRVFFGQPLPTYRVSSDVLGYWIFGAPTASALPSAPGELFLNFGLAGVALGALVLGLATRFLLKWLLGFTGPFEFAWVLTLWLVALMLSDESYLVASLAASNWPLVALMTVVVVRRSGLAGISGRGPGAPAYEMTSLEHINRGKAALLEPSYKSGHGHGVVMGGRQHVKGVKPPPLEKL